MAKKAKTRKPFAAAVDEGILEARTNAKRLRAHAALEREIVKLTKQLTRLIAYRDESLLRFGRELVARGNPSERAEPLAAAVNE